MYDPENEFGAMLVHVPVSGGAHEKLPTEKLFTRSLVPSTRTPAINLALLERSMVFITQPAPTCSTSVKSEGSCPAVLLEVNALGFDVANAIASSYVAL